LSEKYFCNECGDRSCILTTNRKAKQVPATCPWSNAVGFEVVAPWGVRKGPADIDRRKDDGKEEA